MGDAEQPECNADIQSNHGLLATVGNGSKGDYHNGQDKMYPKRTLFSWRVVGGSTAYFRRNLLRIGSVNSEVTYVQHQESVKQA